jgi:hypothetical protein
MPGKSSEPIRCAGNATVVTMRRDCLPKASAETPILVLLDLIELGALDLWIEDQPDPKPSREEAVRRVISEALMRD